MDTVPDHDKTAAFGRCTAVQVTQHPVRGFLYAFFILAYFSVIYVVDNNQVGTERGFTYATRGLSATECPKTDPVIRDEMPGVPFPRLVLRSVVGNITLVEHQLFLQICEQSVRLILIGRGEDNASKFSQSLKVHWQEYVHDNGFGMFTRPFSDEHDVVVFDDQANSFFVEPGKIGIHEVFEIITAEFREVFQKRGFSPAFLLIRFLTDRFETDRLLHFSEPLFIFFLFLSA